MSDKNTLMAEIETVVGEVQELLRKSGIAMQKDDDMEGQLPPPEGQEQPSMDAPPAPESSDAIADQAEDSSEEGSEGGEGLEEAAEESDADLATEAKGLSDEELDQLLEVLMSEKQSRSSQMQQEAPMEAPAQEAPAQEPAEKSMKEEYAKLGKSLETLAGSIEALNKKVDSLSAPQKPAKVAAKAPAANSQDVKVLHKSQPTAPAAKRLTKSETLEFMENQLKKGNKLIDRNVVMDVVATKSEDELHAVQDSLIKKGIEFPKL